MKLYGLATQAEFDLDAVDGYIHYLGEEGDERMQVDLADPALQQVEILVQRHVERIMSRDFFADPESGKCSRCDFETICPHAVEDGD